MQGETEMKFIAYDLGTGGVKASLHNDDLGTLAKTFIEYKTYYSGPNMHEQRPADWWQGIIGSTAKLLAASGTSPKEVSCVSLSGHSLVTVPIDKDRNVLMEQVPIWSDTRAAEEAMEFFQKIDYTDWYMTTGNGFPAPCYSIFKLIWLKKHSPSIFYKIDKVLGSKDFINFMLCGQIFTDPSYASGTGAYQLLEGKMSTGFLEAAGIPLSFFPEIKPSHSIIGYINKKTAEITGLAEGTAVACGGVDNACMALGAVGPNEGKIYTSLGSSSWIPVNSTKPVLDPIKRPYVFAHIQESLFTSAFSIFSGGSSLRWVRETICREIKDENNPYQIMDSMAEAVPVGSHGILFNPSLAGGTSQDKSVNIRGAYVGLHLGTTREDLIRSAMEGIALGLRMSLDFLKEHTELSDEILFCGGGSKSSFWMQMFADIFNMDIIKTNIDQDAASFGAAAIAARAVGKWKDYSGMAALHRIEHKSTPDKATVEEYALLFKKFVHMSNVMADLGDYMQTT